MAELSKQALKVENNTEFPNNNNGQITPTKLRTFNEDMIDSLVDEITFNAFSQSVTASIEASLITASFDNGTRNLTFTKGDSSTFAVNIPDVSGSAGNFVTTSSFNAYTASTDQRLTAIESVSGSWITESETGSFAILGGNQIFTGNNTFIGNTVVSQSAAFGTASFYGPVVISKGINSNVQITGSLIANKVSAYDFDTLFYGSQLGGTTANGTFFGYGSTDYTFTLGAYTGGFDNELQTFIDSTGIYLKDFNGSGYNTFLKLLPNSGTNPKPIFTRGLEVTGSTNIAELTASLQNGYVWVGNEAGKTVTVPTSSLNVLSASYAETSSITRNVVVVARNGEASTLAAGTVVHITSAVGDNPVFTTASYDTEALSSNTFGILRYSSAAGADVEVVVEGVVTGVNTDPTLGFAAGDVLYLSSSGQFTNVQPQAPNQIVTIGQVLRAQQNNGSIYVSINNGWELNELHNVQINNPITNQLLAYESASYGLWKNKSASDLGLATTGSNGFFGNQNINGNVLVSGSVSLLSEGGNGWAFSSKAMFLTNSVQTGLTVESPIHFYKQTKGNMYITVNADDPGSSGSMNIQVHNNQNINISASSVLIDSDLYLDDNGGTTKFWINGNFDAEFLGTKTEWNEVANTLNVTAAEETVELVYNGWGTGYDNGYIVNVGTTGTKFQDWNTSYVNQTWLQIPVNNNNNPAPIFTRGLEVTGSTNIAQLTASLQNGYVWVGNASGKTTTVPTSSFARTDSAQTFSGNQTFNNNLIVNGTTFLSASQVQGNLTVTGQATQTFNEPGNNAEVQVVKVNTFTDSQGYSMAVNTLGWYHYNGEGHEGWSTNLWTADYAYGSAMFHDPDKWEYVLFPSGAAYDANSFGLYDNGDTTTKFKVQTDKIELTGSVGISSVLQLAQQNPLPTGAAGQLAVSGSNLYFHNGSTWSQIN